MSKSQPFLLLVSSLTLLGCSQVGSSSDKSIEAPKGSEVEKEVVTTHYAKAIEAMNNAKAVGANLAGNATLSRENSSKVASNGVTMDNSSSTNLSLSDIDAGVAMSIGDDTKMSMKASANYSYSSSETGVALSSNPDVTGSGSASLAAYLSNGILYADLTGLSNFLTIVDSSDATPLKQKSAIKVSTVDWNDYADYLDDLAEQASKSEYLQIKEGTYSFVYTIDPSKFTISTTTDKISSGTWNGELKAWLSFTEEGFTEAGISGSIKYENAYSFAQSDASYSYESKSKAEISANLKASFSYGSNVKVEEVTDPENYVDTSVDVD